MKGFNLRYAFNTIALAVLLVKVGDNDLTSTSSLGDYLLSNSVTRPHFVQQIVSIQVKVERTTSVLWSLSVAVDVGTVNIGSEIAVKNQTDAFLE